MSQELKTHMPHYIGKIFQNEIISVLATVIKQKINKLIVAAKYFSIILDCTPDVSHVEQISFVVRIVDVTNSNVSVCELFLVFYPVHDTTGEGLHNYLVNDLLKKYDLNVQNIRGQAYDNGSNMRGKNSGLQTRLKTLIHELFSFLVHLTR